MHKIDTIAALKRIPPGTKLTLVAAAFGRGRPSGRIVKAVRSKDIVTQIDDPEHKNNGQESYLSLPSGTKVTPTDKGFRVQYPESGFTEYEFAEPAAPSGFVVVWDNGHSSGTLSGTYATEEEAESVGAEWKADMIAADDDPAAAADAYSYEVVPAKGAAS